MRIAAPFLAALLLAGCSNGPPGAPLERGRAAFEAGDMRTARIELLNALQSEPGNVEARLLQARVHLALGDGLAAEVEITRARERGAPVAETRHLLAHAALLQGDAQRALAEASEAPPAHAAYASRMRGRAHMLLGRNDAASAEFERALAAGPDDSDAWTDLARLRRAQMDIAGALAAVDRAVATGPRNVEALVLRGELSRLQYGLQAALPWFDRALDIDPGNVTALLERAITYGDLGRMRAMLADTRRVQALAPGNPLAFHLQAVLAARARDFELAQSLYRRTGGALDDEPAGMLLASAIDYQTGNIEQAAARLELLLAAQPGNRRARRLLAAAQWRMGDAVGTVATLRPIADRPDADSYSLSLVGRALARIGDMSAASVYLARAARPPTALTAVDGALSEAQFQALREQSAERPGHAPTEIALIAGLLGRGESGEALARARRLQAANPGVPDAHILVGDALGIRGDFRAAAEQYRRAANLALTEAVALRLIEALRRSGQSAAADRVLATFTEQNPRNVRAKLLLAGRHMQAGNWDEAIALYDALRRRIGDRDATILNNLAWAYSESGDVGRALPLARRAWALDRDNPATADTLGWILVRSGRRAEGLTYLERAARGAPDDREIRARLEEARRASEAPRSRGRDRRSQSG